MKLGIRFSIVIAVCVIFSIVLGTLFQSRLFREVQTNFQFDLQSLVLRLGKNHLNSRMLEFHRRFSTASEQGIGALRKLVVDDTGILGIEIWKGTELVSFVSDRKPSLAPPKGNSLWTLISSPLADSQASVRWVGRYENGLTLVVDLVPEVLQEFFEASYGTVIELVNQESKIIASSVNDNWGNRNFHDPVLIDEISSLSGGVIESRIYTALNEENHLGTFTKLLVQPPLFLVVRTHEKLIGEVLQQVNRTLTMVGFLLLVISLGIGVLFSNSLTRPLIELVETMKKVGSGKFGEKVATNSHKNDEIGELAKSFNKMSQDLQKLSGDLAHSERLAAMGKFSAAIAHELKNPLTSMKGLAQVMKTEVDSEDPLDRTAFRDFLVGMEEEVDRAKDIIGDLMAFSRQDKRPKNPLELTGMVNSMKTKLVPVAQSAGVELDFQIPKEPITITGDMVPIQNVFQNIIQNAIDAVESSPGAKEVKFSMGAGEEEALISIEDNGPGIMDEEKLKVFEPFFTTKAFGKGTGLGLAVCHGVIKNHDGKIWVEDGSQGGTRFLISLPLRPAD